MAIFFVTLVLSLLVMVFKESDSLSVNNVFAPVASRVIRCFVVELEGRCFFIGLGSIGIYFNDYACNFCSKLRALNCSKNVK